MFPPEDTPRQRQKEEPEKIEEPEEQGKRDVESPAVYNPTVDRPDESEEVYQGEFIWHSTEWIEQYGVAHYAFTLIIPSVVVFIISIGWVLLALLGTEYSWPTVTKLGALATVFLIALSGCYGLMVYGFTNRLTARKMTGKMVEGSKNKKEYRTLRDYTSLSTLGGMSVSVIMFTVCLIGLIILCMVFLISRAQWIGNDFATSVFQYDTNGVNLGPKYISLTAGVPDRFVPCANNTMIDDIDAQSYENFQHYVIATGLLLAYVSLSFLLTVTRPETRNKIHENAPPEEKTKPDIRTLYDPYNKTPRRDRDGLVCKILYCNEDGPLFQTKRKSRSYECDLSVNIFAWSFRAGAFVVFTFWLIYVFSLSGFPNAGGLAIDKIYIVAYTNVATMGAIVLLTAIPFAGIITSVNAMYGSSFAQRTKLGLGTCFLSFGFLAITLVLLLWMFYQIPPSTVDVPTAILCRVRPIYREYNSMLVFVAVILQLTMLPIVETIFAHQEAEQRLIIREPEMPGEGSYAKMKSG